MTVVCDCDNDRLPGAGWPWATDGDDSFPFVERCDNCQRFPHDEAAALALIRAGHGVLAIYEPLHGDSAKHGWQIAVYPDPRTGDPRMTKTERPSTGLKLALELREEYSNDWGGGEQDPAALAASKYAVCIKRDGDGWVTTAENWQDIVDIEASCLHAEFYVEYVDAVYDVATGERISYRCTTTVAMRAPNGEIYYAFEPTRDPTWVLCVRHPDYENGYDTWPGLTPGVEEVTIDTGAEFSNGRPSRIWCAERYFELPDDAPTPFKRMALSELKSLCDDQEKLKRGEDPGRW